MTVIPFCKHHVLLQQFTLTLVYYTGLGRGERMPGWWCWIPGTATQWNSCWEHVSWSQWLPRPWGRCQWSGCPRRHDRTSPHSAGGWSPTCRRRRWCSSSRCHRHSLRIRHVSHVEYKYQILKLGVLVLYWQVTRLDESANRHFLAFSTTLIIVKHCLHVCLRKQSTRLRCDGGDQGPGGRAVCRWCRSPGSPRQTSALPPCCPSRPSPEQPELIIIWY